MNKEPNDRNPEVEANPVKDTATPATLEQHREPIRPATADLKWWQFFALAHA